MGNKSARDSLGKSPPGPCCTLCGNSQGCTRSHASVFPTSRWTHHQKQGVSEVILARGEKKQLDRARGSPITKFLWSSGIATLRRAPLSPGSSLHRDHTWPPEQRHPSHPSKCQPSSSQSIQQSHIPQKIQRWGQSRESHPHFPAAGEKLLQLSEGSAVTPVEIKENLRCRGEPSRSL